MNFLSMEKSGLEAQSFYGRTSSSLKGVAKNFFSSFSLILFFSAAFSFLIYGNLLSQGVEDKKC